MIDDHFTCLFSNHLKFQYDNVEERLKKLETTVKELKSIIIRKSFLGEGY